MIASTRRPNNLAILVCAAAIVAGCSRDAPLPENHQVAQQEFGLLPEAVITLTTNYRIYSTATQEQTARVAEAVEALHKAYAALFDVTEQGEPLELVLYRDRAQFRQYNQASPWAEAYYRLPRCFAYAQSGDNPYHWMIHEATHQLLRQRSGYRPARWLNEGIASYPEPVDSPETAYIWVMPTRPLILFGGCGPSN
ncbi:MAG: hypothetical protein R3F58_10600 [Steroidobacteraceae bacterium]